MHTNYDLLCEKMEKKWFGRRDFPHTLRRQLQDLKQERGEVIKEFAEKTQKMATDGYPDTPDEFPEIVATDAFLKGCSDTAAALSVMDKIQSHWIMHLNMPRVL